MERAFVVMGNDFPDAVFTTQETAEAHCVKRAEEDKVRFAQIYGPNRAHPRIYWRVYDFPLLTGETA